MGDLVNPLASLVRMCFGSGVALQHFDRFPWRKTVSSGMWLDFTMDSFPVFALGAHEFVIKLEIHPHACGDSEEAAEAEVVFRCAAAFALLHLG